MILPRLAGGGRVFGLLGFEEGGGGFGVDDDYPVFREFDDCVRLLAGVVGLFGEVAVIAHAGGFDDSAELGLGPEAGLAVVAEGSVQLGGFRRDLIVLLAGQFNQGPQFVVVLGQWLDQFRELGVALVKFGAGLSQGFALALRGDLDEVFGAGPHGVGGGLKLVSQRWLAFWTSVSALAAFWSW